ncbi:MAG: hypothetical protein N3A62_00480 [Thermodesulfovibrionales bacterium]|nr:hypothetical protein [Thermodesulfovibrionales bacterium]
MLAVAFVIVTFWGEGGNKFRYVGERIGGFVEKYTEELAKLSDDLYGLVDEKKKVIEKGRKLFED